METVAEWHLFYLYIEFHEFSTLQMECDESCVAWFYEVFPEIQHPDLEKLRHPHVPTSPVEKSFILRYESLFYIASLTVNSTVPTKK